MLNLQELLRYLYASGPIPAILQKYAEQEKNLVPNITLDTSQKNNPAHFASHDDCFIFIYSGEIGQLTSYTASVRWGPILITSFAEGYGPIARELAEWAVKTSIKNYILENHSFYCEKVDFNNLERRLREDLKNIEADLASGVSLTQIIKTSHGVFCMNIGRNSIAAHGRHEPLELSNVLHDESKFIHDLIKRGEIVFSKSGSEAIYNQRREDLSYLAGINWKTDHLRFQYETFPLKEIKDMLIYFAGSQHCKSHLMVSKLVSYVAKTDTNQSRQFFTRKLNIYLKQMNLSELSFTLCFQDIKI